MSPNRPTPDERSLSSAESQAALEAVAEAGDAPVKPSRRRARAEDGNGSAAAAPGDEAASIEATSVSIVQGGAQEVRAERVDIKQGGAGRVESSEINVRQGGIGLARGERIQVEMGAVGVALAGNIEIHQGIGRLVAARDSVRLEQAGAMNVIANRVEMGPQSGAVLVIARNVTGEVRTLVDWRAGVAFAVTLGVIGAILRALRGR
ncbi:MAG TPA: hypothetical protein VFK38_10985 [Candidatus Limnocylindrales bacterium]|nr:hypothetical protein [Candidatus Limnocylindrales bacterium]